jgi:hypothetical protein
MGRSINEARSIMRLSERAISVAGLIGLIAAACEYTTAPLPSSAARFEPPPVYSTYWSIVEACSERTIDVRDWTFFTVPRGALREAGYGDAAAYTSVANHQIVFEAGVESNPSDVRHEMLHAVLGTAYARGNPAQQHPPKYFRGLCEGVVYCDQGCLDAGPPPALPPADAPVLALSSLQVGVEVRSQVSRTGVDRALPIVLRATNPTNHSVWLALEPTLGASPPAAHWIGFRIAPAEQSLPIGDLTRVDSTGIVFQASDGKVAFAAGQTRWLVFDMSGRLYPPGDYQVVGVFNTRQISAPLLITP